MPRRSRIKKDADSFRAKAEEFIALAQQVEKLPKSPQREAILNDAKHTLIIVRQAMQQADDIRNWAREVFGAGADSHPLAEFASKALTNSLNSTIGFQCYRMKNFLAGKRVPIARSPYSTMAFAALSQFVEH